MLKTTDQTHTHTHTHTHIYIYIICFVYIYIYVCMHVIYMLFFLSLLAVTTCHFVQLVTELLWSYCGCPKRACYHENIFVTKRTSTLGCLYDYTVIQFLVCAYWALCVSIYDYERLKVFVLLYRLWMPYRVKRYIVQFLFFTGLT